MRRYFKENLLNVVLISVFIGVFFIQGCGLLGIAPPDYGPCATDGSYIGRDGQVYQITAVEAQEKALCKISPWWNESKMAFMLTNYAALSKEWYHPKDVYESTDTIRDAIKPVTANVGDLVTSVTGIVGQKKELFLITEAMDTYKLYTDLIIDDFTWFYFDSLLNRLDVQAKMFE